MREYQYRRSTYSEKFQRPIDDLLRDQRQGKTLTLDERSVVKKYAEQQRIKKSYNKKKK